MVFNPPVLKDDEAAEPPTLIEVSPQRSADAYVEQAKRGFAWVSILFIVWLWQRLLCYLDLPPHCDLPMTCLQVLTDILVLFSFGLTQVMWKQQVWAWFVEILEERRFRHLFKEAWWPIVVIVTGLAISAFERSDWWQELRFNKSTDWSESQVVVAALFAVVAALFIGWHFAEAWRVLPGAFYVSGNVNINVVIKENLHRIYNVSRGLILVYALLYAAFAFDKREGFEQHYVLLAWVLSLFAQFKNRISILFLALCTGVFVQGLGSYRLRFLCQSMGNQGNGYVGDSEDQ